MLSLLPVVVAWKVCGFEVGRKTIRTVWQTGSIIHFISFMKSPAYIRKVHQIQLRSGFSSFVSLVSSAKMIDWISLTPGGLPIVRENAWLWIVGLQCPEQSYTWNFAMMSEAFKNLQTASRLMALLKPMVWSTSDLFPHQAWSKRPKRQLGCASDSWNSRMTLDGAQPESEGFDAGLLDYFLSFQGQIDMCSLTKGSPMTAIAQTRRDLWFVS